MATTSAILEEVRTAIAAVPRARGGGNLARYLGRQPFRAAADSRADAFHVELRDYEYLEGFGVGGQKEAQLHVTVLLGHAVAGTEEQREGWAARDCERVADTLERRAWETPGVRAVFLSQPTVTDRSNGDAWVSELVFRIVFVGDA